MTCKICDHSEAFCLR